MNTGRFLLAVLAASATLFAVGAVFYFGVPVVAPNIEPQFKNLALYRDWNGWTSTCMLLHPLVCGVVFAGVYAAARRDEHAAGEGGRAGHDATGARGRASGFAWNAVSSDSHVTVLTKRLLGSRPERFFIDLSLPTDEIETD